MQQKSLEAKTKIKERFNETAQKVTIDAKDFVLALLAKKDTSKLVLDKPVTDSPSGDQPSIENIAINFEQPILTKEVRSELIEGSSLESAATHKQEKSSIKIDIDLTSTPNLVELQVSDSVSPKK